MLCISHLLALSVFCLPTACTSFCRIFESPTGKSGPGRLQPESQAREKSVWRTLAEPCAAGSSGCYRASRIRSTAPQTRPRILPDEETSIPERDQPALNTVSDNLIDIAVYATMALNRFKRGDVDPQAQEMLCRKIRSKAIKTRRLANRLSHPGKPDRDVL